MKSDLGEQSPPALFQDDPMKIHAFCIALILFASNVTAEDFKPELFESLKLVYEDDFSGATLNSDFWQVRQGSTWAVKDGVLVGGPSPKEFQDKKIAEGDKAHAGFKPVIWLEKVPENLVVQFRVRFDGEDYMPGFPLIDVGHHVHTLTFSEGKTKLAIKKNEKVITTDKLAFPLNEWVDVAIELKKGVMLVRLNDKKLVVEDALIDMVDQQQIDFKGIDHGGIQIDDVRVYEGLN